MSRVHNTHSTLLNKREFSFHRAIYTLYSTDLFIPAVLQYSSTSMYYTT